MRKRIWSTGILFLSGAGLVILDQVLRSSHIRTSSFSGWLMFSMIVFLSLFGLRKKFSFFPAKFFPMGTAAVWLQFHIYVGLLTSIVFLVHVGYRIPTGVLEQVLALLYFSTFISGVIGLALSRMIPRRLTARGEEVIFERISLFRRKLLDELQVLSFPESKESSSSALIDLYESHLCHYFTGPRNTVSHLFFSDRPRSKLLLVVSGCRPFLSSADAPKLDRIMKLIQKKDDLDFHFTHQGILKLWLFIHIPFTYCLLIFAIFHVLIVYAFT